MCRISFNIDYTSASQITAATANYRVLGSSVPLLNPPLDIKQNIGGTITLPDIQTPGNYELIITLTNQDNITVNSIPTSFKVGNCNGNKPPIANAGIDQTITLPTNFTTLIGSASDSDGSISSYLWSCTNPNVTIATPNASTTMVSGLAQGPNTFQLTVTDNSGATDTDEIIITVSAELIKTEVTTVSKFPLSGITTLTDVTGIATVSNPNITGLVYRWYLNNVDKGTTTTDSKSFGKLPAGSHTIKVGLVGSTGNNHLTTQQSIYFSVSQSSTGSTGGTGGGSFLAGTLVRMSNGTLQKVENIKLGDLLVGSQGNVTVLEKYTYESEAKKYRLNEDNYFVTETHPIMTEKGWKSFNPEKTKTIIPSIEVGLLQKGDILIKEDGKREILSNTDYITEVNLVYNFGVSDTNDFYANGYLVHNKMIMQLDPGNPIP